MRRQAGFFDVDDRLKRLSDLGDQLEAFEVRGPCLGVEAMMAAARGVTGGAILADRPTWTTIASSQPASCGKNAQTSLKRASAIYRSAWVTARVLPATAGDWHGVPRLVR